MFEDYGVVKISNVNITNTFVIFWGDSHIFQQNNCNFFFLSFFLPFFSVFFLFLTLFRSFFHDSFLFFYKSKFYFSQFIQDGNMRYKVLIDITFFVCFIFNTSIIIDLLVILHF